MTFARVILSFLPSFPILMALGCAQIGRSYDPSLYGTPIPELTGPLCTEATAAGLGKTECDRRRIAFVKRAMQATVVILPPIDGSSGRAGGGQRVGTGVIIADDGMCVTANHVVSDSKYTLVQYRIVAGGGAGLQFEIAGSVMMEVIARDETNDVAVLRPVLGEKYSPVLHAELGLPNDFGYGSIVWHFGALTLARAGKVYAVDPDGLTSGLKDIHPLYGLDGDARSGDSGAPVFAGNGKVVGILLGGADPDVAQGTYRRALFVPVDAVLALLPERASLTLDGTPSE